MIIKPILYCKVLILQPERKARKYLYTMAIWLGKWYLNIKIQNGTTESCLLWFWYVFLRCVHIKKNNKLAKDKDNYILCHMISILVCLDNGTGWIISQVYRVGTLSLYSLAYVCRSRGTSSLLLYYIYSNHFNFI